MDRSIKWHCDSASPGSTIATDSQTPRTGRKRKQKQRSFSPEQLDTKERSIERQDQRGRSSSSSSDSYWIWDRAERSYWDSLSTLCLTSNALGELNRRNALTKTSLHKTIPVDRPEQYKDLSHFARHGGPDLSDIRKHQNLDGISSTPTSLSSRRHGKSALDRKPSTDDDQETESSSAFDWNFGNHLIENQVFRSTRLGKGPVNYQEWVEAIKRPRGSLSPSCMSKEYEALCTASDDARSDKGKIMTQVLPKIMSKNTYPSGTDVKFDNLEPLTQRIIDARPNYYEGHRAGPENQSVRENLRTIITPSIRGDAPFLPNFFLEVKDNYGYFAVAERQARHVGALAARGMHRLQMLGKTEAYDGNAYTVSAFYYGETLYLFTHHLTQPEGASSRPHTHMVPLKTLSLTDSPESLCEGLTVIRNASDKANEYREQFIKDANIRLDSTLHTPKESDDP